MATTQLDILALEPFYGGPRRSMLETLVRFSRHRWTLLRLPPRRIERRLTTAAHWFAEQLSRHWVGRVDMLFTSEAMNLADLYRLMPPLAKKPSVVYFHSNQLPPITARTDGPLDMVNLNTAMAATEIWFNSLYHLRTFLARATALVKRHPELSGHNPLPDLTAKARLMPPPVDLTPMRDGQRVARKPRRIFVETRDANVQLLNAVLQTLARRGEVFELVTVGPVEELDQDLPRTTLVETEEATHARAIRECGLFLSVRPDAPADLHAVRALATGSWPIVPRGGVYPELLPKYLHDEALHDGSASDLVGRIQDFWGLPRSNGIDAQLSDMLHRHDPISACREMDQRLEDLTITGGHAG